MSEKAEKEKKHPPVEKAPEEANGGLAQELAEAKEQAAEYLEGWKRAQAELANSRKRLERDAADARLMAAGRAASRWFPILDDFERALKKPPAADTWEQWVSGVGMIYRKGLAALEAEGITAIEPAPGSDFDPQLHEAVTMEIQPGKRDGEILDVLCRGYRLGERILRPAQVRVACAPPGEPEPAPSEAKND